MHGKTFSFPHYCNDCHQIGGIDTLAELSVCRHCGSASLTSYEAKSKKVPNQLLERLGANILHKRGYHLTEEELSPTYCYVQKKRYVLLRKGNYCPSCRGSELTFFIGMLYD
jgi:RNA polymerase subunit RPABC4/transcription elongation factor Spt4